MNRTHHGLDAFSLRLIALVCMLLDHLWLLLAPEQMWMHCAGRLAFPIFAFQIAVGYRHTADYSRYRNRLLTFALVSEIPFDLMLFGTPICFSRQNVMFTLLLGLLAIRSIDSVQENRSRRNLCTSGVKLCLIFLLSLIAAPDYGLAGVLTVLLFHLFQGTPHDRLGQFIGLAVLSVLAGSGSMISVRLLSFRLSFPIQCFAILALIPIRLYNGQKGLSLRGLRLAWYLFYPVHMLILSCFRF